MATKITITPKHTFINVDNGDVFIAPKHSDHALFVRVPDFWVKVQGTEPTEYAQYNAIQIGSGYCIGMFNSDNVIPVTDFDVRV